jgi:hypothetical protein
MATFKSFEDWEKSFTKRITKTVKDSVSDLAARVVDDTPVETSALKSSWNTSTGSPEFSFNPDKQDGGASAMMDLKTTVDSWNIKEDLYFVTGADYAWRAEYGGWEPPRWRGTEPYAMVELNTNNWQKIFTQQLNKNFN